MPRWRRTVNTMALMFESRYLIHPTPYALATPQLQRDYLQCWHGLKKHFNGQPESKKRHYSNQRSSVEIHIDIMHPDAAGIAFSDPESAVRCVQHGC